MLHPFYLVDAFASEPFTGNTAGVCILDAPQAGDWMQKVAAEMKHSETAFVSETPDAFGLRWFTPKVEVDLCGHATLASAHILWHTGRLPQDREAAFHTRSGVLTCRRDGERISMDFPAAPTAQVSPPEGLSDALGGRPVWVGLSRFDVLALFESADDVRALNPDMDALASADARGVIATAASDDPRYDFVSRFFAPAVGVPEDDATGSAHCVLGPFWGERLGKTELLGYQASPRGAEVGIALRGERLDLIGSAVTVLEGRLL